MCHRLESCGLEKRSEWRLKINQKRQKLLIKIIKDYEKASRPRPWKMDERPIGCVCT